MGQRRHRPKPVTAPAAPAVVGEVKLLHKRVGDTVQLHATRMPKTASIGLHVLQETLAGRVAGLTVLADQLRMTLANGVWVYRIGEYHPLTQGLVLRLIHGTPLHDA